MIFYLFYVFSYWRFHLICDLLCLVCFTKHSVYGVHLSYCRANYFTFLKLLYILLLFLFVGGRSEDNLSDFSPSTILTPGIKLRSSGGWVARTLSQRPLSPTPRHYFQWLRTKPLHACTAVHLHLQLHGDTWRVHPDSCRHAAVQICVYIFIWAAAFISSGPHTRAVDNEVIPYLFEQAVFAYQLHHFTVSVTTSHRLSTSSTPLLSSDFVKRDCYCHSRFRGCEVMRCGGLELQSPMTNEVEHPFTGSGHLCVSFRGILFMSFAPFKWGCFYFCYFCPLTRKDTKCDIYWKPLPLSFWDRSQVAQGCLTLAVCQRMTSNF